jgi:hypothetical protein
MTGHFQHPIHSIDGGYNGRPLHGERLEASTRPTASPITLHYLPLAMGGPRSAHIQRPDSWATQRLVARQRGGGLFLEDWAPTPLARLALDISRSGVDDRPSKLGSRLGGC